MLFYYIKNFKVIGYKLYDSKIVFLLIKFLNLKKIS